MINEAMHTNGPWRWEFFEKECDICHREFCTNDPEDTTCTVCMDALWSDEEA